MGAESPANPGHATASWATSCTTRRAPGPDSWYASSFAPLRIVGQALPTWRRYTFIPPPASSTIWPSVMRNVT